MTQKVVVDPLNRQNGLARVEVEIEGRTVVEARIGNANIKGFELLIQGRDPMDGPFFMQRICGICSSAHGVAGALAVEDACRAYVPPNGILLRNLIFGADSLQNHLRHFYILSLPDFAELPDQPPFVPHYRTAPRFSAAETARLVKNYQAAVPISRKAHDLLVVFGTRAPHQQAMLAGGVTTPVLADRVMNATSLLSELRSFIDAALIPDTELLASRYPEYYTIGTRPVNLLSYGQFIRHDRPGERYSPAGAVIDGRREDVDLDSIAEDVSHAWYKDREQPPRHPSQGRTDLADDLSTGYTFTKAPRYRGLAMEGGPLARAWLRGDYRRGVSVLDRIVTRSLEARQVGEWMADWLKALQPGEPGFATPKRRRSASGAGLWDSMRGPLGHWLRIRGGRIVHYQVVTPSAWNLSPHDGRNRRGPVEEALVGTVIADPENPVEIGRIVRSFDPCSSCSVQVIDLVEGERGRLQ
ncbi:MAG: nickel-dependent hydrogenase large subunit [Chitinophagales bacterium]